MALFTIENLTFSYPEQTVRAIDDLTLTVPEGAFVVLCGPSGCGKSTLLSVVSGLEPLTAGTVEVDGAPVRGPSGKVGFMPQRDQLFPWRTIRDNVTLGLTVTKKRTPETLAYADALLKRYGLWEFAGKRPSQLSGGMRQRCALIRTMATNPKILLLDEPFSALDYQTRLSVSDDIHNIIRREGKTALLVTHDISESVSMSDRVVVLSARPGRVKAIHDLSELRGLTPMQRRDHALFHTYFNAIWKELELSA